MTTTVFLSYRHGKDNYDEVGFVSQVNFHVGEQAAFETICYVDQVNDEWRDSIADDLKRTDVFLFFLGTDIGRAQRKELEIAESTDKIRHLVLVVLSSASLPCERTDGAEFSNQLKTRFRIDHTVFHQTLEGDYGDLDNPLGAMRCASEVVWDEARKWDSYDGLPIGFPFDYEKRIIDEFVKGEGNLPDKYVKLGCTRTWPVVSRIDTGSVWKMDDSLQDAVGVFRTEEDQIYVDARQKRQHGLTQYGLTLPEAGPRQGWHYPYNGSALRVGILTSGGIAPGINAIIAGIVERHARYRADHEEKYGRSYSLEITGYRDGFSGLERRDLQVMSLMGDDVKKYLDFVRSKSNLGGSILGTSRNQTLTEFEQPSERKKFLTRVLRKLGRDQIDILYVIGGDGAMRTAHAAWTLARSLSNNVLSLEDQEFRRIQNLSVVGIPKSMDNDILWVWQSLGFESAVEKAKGFVHQLHTEVTSNPRLGVVQLFGSDSGFVVSMTALASGVCDAALVPEKEFRLSELGKHIKSVLHDRYRAKDGRSPYALVVMGETAIPVDYAEHAGDIALDNSEREAIEKFKKCGCRVYGQTPDELRTASLKIVSEFLRQEIRNMALEGGDDYWKTFRVLTTEPRYFLRAIEPSASDVIQGKRLGTLAVDNAIAGYTDFMISKWLTEFVLVPMELVVLGRKRVPFEGIFWKSVVDSTGQP